MIPSSIDIVIVVGRSDYKLLRHFLLSINLFSRLNGLVHVVISKEDQCIADYIDLKTEGSVVVHYKDEIRELCDNDFKNQMYLKLHADLIAKTEYIWIADADYLLVQSLEIDDFFSSDGKVIWYYQNWQRVPEESWRGGSEAIFGRPIQNLYMAQPPYVFKKTILECLRSCIDVSRLFFEDRASEFVIYGAYAFWKGKDHYRFVGLFDYNRIVGCAYKVNQRPPTYCLQNPGIKLSGFAGAKILVFWSHWYLAESKMAEFLQEAFLLSCGSECAIHIDRREILPIINLSEKKMQIELPGVFADGWLPEIMKFKLISARQGLLRFAIGKLATINDSIINFEVDGINISRVIGHQIEVIDIPASTTGPSGRTVTVSISGNDYEPESHRALFARCISLDFVETSSANQ